MQSASRLCSHDTRKSSFLTELPDFHYSAIPAPNRVFNHGNAGPYVLARIAGARGDPSCRAHGPHRPARRRDSPPAGARAFVCRRSRPELHRAEEAVWDEINRGSFPGASLAVGRYGRVVLEQGMGRTGAGGAEVDPDRTVYDIASLSKVVGTTTAVMLLVEDGKMSLDDPVQAYLPEFSGFNKNRVTIRHLLTHKIGRAHV